MKKSKKFIYLTSDELEKLTDELAKIIAADNKKNKNKLEMILAISRGGLFPGLYLSDRLQLPLAIISCESYERGSITPGEIKISNAISSIGSLKNNILVVDDLVDTGRTMRAISEGLKKADWLVKTAVIYIKPWSRFLPDYSVRITDAFVVFPYQKKEYGGREWVQK